MIKTNFLSSRVEFWLNYIEGNYKKNFKTFSKALFDEIYAHCG